MSFVVMYALLKNGFGLILLIGGFCQCDKQYNLLLSLKSIDYQLVTH